jgi:hypothetical protein
MSSNPRRYATTIEARDEPRSYVSNGQRITVVPLTIKQRQNRKILTPPPSDSPNASAFGGFDEPMIRTLAKGFYWQKLLDEGRYAHVGELAKQLRLERGWIAEVLRMTLLAPDIVTAIVEGRQPRHVNLHALRGRIDIIPRDWNEQRWLLGFPANSERPERPCPLTAAHNPRASDRHGSSEMVDSRP